MYLTVKARCCVSIDLPDCDLVENHRFSSSRLGTYNLSCCYRRNVWRKAMSRGFPSMTALLGLLAVAGYQNRDKIAEMLGGLGQNSSGQTGQSGLGGLLGQLRGSLGGTSPGGLLSGGLSELVDWFKQTGHADT